MHANSMQINAVLLRINPSGSPSGIIVKSRETSTTEHAFAARR